MLSRCVGRKWAHKCSQIRVYTYRQARVVDYGRVRRSCGTCATEAVVDNSISYLANIRPIAKYEQTVSEHRLKQKHVFTLIGGSVYWASVTIKNTHTVMCTCEFVVPACNMRVFGVLSSITSPYIPSSVVHLCDTDWNRPPTHTYARRKQLCKGGIGHYWTTFTTHTRSVTHRFFTCTFVFHHACVLRTNLSLSKLV
jgi:hypothetical protein